MQGKSKYTSVPVQYDVRRSHQKQNTKQRNQPGTNNTTKPNKPQNRPRQEDKPKTHRRRSHKHQPRQRTTRRGEGDKRRPARKERADVRKGSRTGERKQHKPRRRARAALAVSEGKLDHTKANTSATERGAHEQHHNMV